MTAPLSSLTATAGLLGWSTAATATAATASLPSWADVQRGVLAAVSSKLGMTRSDLTAALRTGKTMGDVAATAGLSSSDLRATIQASLEQSGLPSGVNFATMAARMASNRNASSIDDNPARSAGSASTISPGLGIDTSSVNNVAIGGLSLSTDEVSMLLGGTHRNSLDAYL